MKHWFMALAFLIAGITGARAAQNPPVVLCVQLIHGTDGAPPPEETSKPAAPALRHRLQMFKWKNYWETERQNVSLGAVDKTRLHLTEAREVEIERHDGKVTISLYLHGKLTRRRTQSLDNQFYIAGGDQEDSGSWFVVVHREKL